jgi:hypothetical protein
MRNKTWSTYPWWLLLVGFAFGVLVTLWATQGRAQTVTVYRDDGRMTNEIWIQATRLVQDATLSAQGIQAAVSNYATANAVSLQAAQPGAVDPLLMTATAMMIEATQQAAQR